ncbi:zinc finger domain-containing protein [Streptomyces umbrinus]
MLCGRWRGFRGAAHLCHRAAPAGSPCRTGKCKMAIPYHTARLRLVSQLAKALSVPTPTHRAVARR